MLPDAGRFDVWFRLLLALIMFSPILLVLYIHRTKLYHNSDRIWIKKYTFSFLLNVFAYVLVLMFNDDILHTLYYYVSVGCSLYIVYLELFDRLIIKSTVTATSGNLTPEPPSAKVPDVDIPVLNEISGTQQRNAVLIERLDTYMKKNNAWRDPDLSLNMLAAELFTNRTTLAQALRDNGYENYTNYIKKLRIDDFLNQIDSGQSTNFQEAFFSVGFRSRSTALRNFQQLTGMTPSEYFQNKNDLTEESLLQKN